MEAGGFSLRSAELNQEYIAIIEDALSAIRFV